MKIFDFSVNRPVAVTMIILIAILLGAVSFGRLGLDLFPEMELPMLVVSTTYSGAGPEEIEEQVTRVLEGAIGTVSGVKNITSYSMRDSSMILAEFAWGTDLNYAVNQMRDRLDLYGMMLPGDADKPTIIKMDPSSMPIMQIAVSGDASLEELSLYVTDNLQPLLERIDGVASVTLSGNVEEEIRITADPQKLTAYGVSLSQITGMLYQENANVSAGSVEEGMKEHAVRVTGEFTDVSDIENLQITSAYGGTIPLSSLASIERVTKEQTSYVYINGEPGLNVAIMKASDANLVQTSAKVNQVLDELTSAADSKYHVRTFYDQADFINLAIDNVISSGLQGAILAVLILVLFLRNWRSTLIIAISIPVSVIATFAMMYFTGVTLNMVSLGGLALGIGMMVDNSIVLLENIYRHRQEGYSRKEAALLGGKEVAGAVVASTVTTIVVFLPIIFVEGLAAQIFRPMALTIACSLLASLASAFLVVPMMSNKIMKVEKPNGGFFSRIGDKVENGLQAVRRFYAKVLDIALRNKGKVVLLSAVMVIGSLCLIPFIGMEFIPEQDTGGYTVTVDLPNGTTLEESLRVARQVEDIILAVPENEELMYSAGGSGGMMSGSNSSVSFSGTLKSLDERDREIDVILDDIRDRLKSVPGADIEVAASSAMMMSSSGVSVNLTGDDLDQLGLFADVLAAEMEKVEGTREITTSLSDGNPEVKVVVDRARAAQYGLSSSTVASAVSTAVRGSTATQIREGGQEIDVRLIVDKQYRNDFNDLESLMLTSASGSMVPLGAVADLVVDVSPSSIVRYNQSREVTVSCSTIGRSVNEVVGDIQDRIAGINVPSGVTIDFGGSYESMMDSFGDLGLALILAVILVYMVMAVQFEHLLYPFVIMFSLPPMFIGVFLGLFLTGRTINVVSLIGVIMLAGIVVNNAIVLVDYINVLRREHGMERMEAIRLAGPTRLRPIMMTTLTTVLAMLPMAIGLGEGAELMAPLSTVVAAGLTFSTLITLILVPCMYIYMEDISQRFLKHFHKKEKQTKEAQLN